MQLQCIGYFLGENDKIFTLLFSGKGYILSEGWYTNLNSGRQKPYKPIIESRLLTEVTDVIKARGYNQIDTFRNQTKP